MSIFEDSKLVPDHFRNALANDFSLDVLRDETLSLEDVVVRDPSFEYGEVKSYGIFFNRNSSKVPLLYMVFIRRTGMFGKVRFDGPHYYEPGNTQAPLTPSVVPLILELAIERSKAEINH